MNTNELLDAVKARYELQSDYALAKKIGMSRERVSRYRNTNGELGDDAALKVAELLELDPAYVLASMEAQRTKSDAARKVWEQAAERLKQYGAAAALALLAVVPASMPSPAEAGMSGGTMYIMLNNSHGSGGASHNGVLDIFAPGPAARLRSRPSGAAVRIAVPPLRGRASLRRLTTSTWI